MKFEYPSVGSSQFKLCKLHKTKPTKKSRAFEFFFKNIPNLIPPLAFYMNTLQNLHTQFIEFSFFTHLLWIRPATAPKHYFFSYSNHTNETKGSTSGKIFFPFDNFSWNSPIVSFKMLPPFLILFFHSNTDNKRAKEFESFV